MYGKFILASAVLIPLGLAGLSASAMADVWNPNSSYNTKYDIPLRMSAPTHHVMLSCEAAGRIVRQDGFNHVQARQCGGKVDVFRAERHGHPVTVDVNRRTGRAWVA